MRDKLEQHQVWIYLAAIVSGLLTGGTMPEATATWELALWPVLGLLLYATFTQVPLVHVSGAFRDRRFLVSLLAGNFLLMPCVVWLLLTIVPDDRAIKLGVLLVLLVPCTDWFISFTHLGRGDAARAIAAAPVLLVTQILLLPFYLWLLIGEDIADMAIASHLLPAFIGLILLPLSLAWITEKLAEKRKPLGALIDGLDWCPVPLLAMVVFLIAASQVGLVLESGRLLWSVVLVFALYLLAAATIGKLLACVAGLPAPAARTLVFSLGTRNSFVVLPLAISLPDAWSAAVVVIVLQSLVELFGMIAFLKWVPDRLIKSTLGTR